MKSANLVPSLGIRPHRQRERGIKRTVRQGRRYGSSNKVIFVRRLKIRSPEGSSFKANEKGRREYIQRPPGSKSIHRINTKPAPVLLDLAAAHFAVESKTKFHNQAGGYRHLNKSPALKVASPKKRPRTASL